MSQPPVGRPAAKTSSHPNRTAPIRVLIAEDQALLRSSLAALIGAEPDLEVAAQAADGLEAVELAGSLRPDVVVMDVQMPRLDGVEATRRICADPALAGTRVLVLTMFEVEEYVLGALRAGASGFLLKDAAPQAVVDAVRTVHAGQSLLSPQVMARLLARGVRGCDGGMAEGMVEQVARLTPRQREVLVLIARGLSNQQIEAELAITRATCRTHITALLSRLGARDRAQLVVAAYEAGLVVPGG
ncbi:Response regulator protein vraR [Actinomyces bovis]|uniref:Response regulator protein vraR n=1 Tax=Actinomyces bovis TaxID=1658 RepID=A0ABY1VNI3_9ACTO|nr:response regulator transcription factor [Actinomyces bovis]SPT53671.1 Response regulator protein vraR [Actinomyces bovis]VEG55772.1 Response regulator protein vraR [Actinomyces israelii]